MHNYEKKYLDLLLAKCTNFENTKSILINYHRENRSFIKKLVRRLKKEGITDIYLDEEDPLKYREILQKSPKEIKESKYFDKSIWNEYALKNANFLMLKSEYPGLMDDLDLKKVALATKLTLDSREGFFQKQKKNEVPWSIAVLPSKTWAEQIFPNTHGAYKKLFKLIGTLCLLDEKRPDKAWDLLMKSSYYMTQKLNKLKIKSLHYTNSLGTNLKVGLREEALWCGLAQDTLCIVNLPSYEYFTSPDYHKTSGIVYGSKPLYYNNQKID